MRLLVVSNRSHKCPATTVAPERPASSEELDNAEARIVRLTRGLQNLSVRIQQAELKCRDEETANARSTAEVARLTATLENERRQTEKDLVTSEQHGELLNRKLAETVHSLAAANVENEELRKSVAAYKGALSVGLG